MVEPKPLMRFSVFLIAILAYLTASVPAMSYEEPEYSIVKKTDVYEVRQYKKRTVAELYTGKRIAVSECCLTTFQGLTKAPKKLR